MLRERLLSVRDVAKDVSLSRTRVLQLVKAGDFPAPVRVSEGRVAWRDSEVQAWIRGRPRVEPKAESVSA